MLAEEVEEVILKETEEAVWSNIKREAFRSLAESCDQTAKRLELSIQTPYKLKRTYWLPELTMSKSSGKFLQQGSEVIFESFFTDFYGSEWAVAYALKIGQSQIPIKARQRYLFPLSNQGPVTF